MGFATMKLGKTYQLAKQSVFAVANIPNGYFGEWIECELALLPGGVVVAVHSFGFHRTVLPQVTDVKEAIWLMTNHPNYRDYFQQVKEVGHD